MQNLRITLKFLSFLTGIGAAILWLRSAAPFPPAPGATFGGTSPIDPFSIALHHAAILNQRAAIATAISVFCMAVAEIIEVFSGRNSSH